MAWRGKDILTLLLNGPLLTRQIAAGLGTSSDNAQNCLKALRRNGFMNSIHGLHEITASGRHALGNGHEFKAGPCSGNATSRKSDTLRDKAWRVLQRHEFVSVDDLMMLLSTEGGKWDADNLRSYVRALEQSGYLFKKVNGVGRYRLRAEQNTGPKAPAWNKATRIVRDLNNGKVIQL